MVKTDDMKLSRLEQEKLVQMRSAHAKAELDNRRVWDIFVDLMRDICSLL
jgi:hypothetical protein